MDGHGLSRRDQGVDVLIAAAFAALSIVLAVGVVDDAAKEAGAVALGVVHSAALAFRRRWPVPVVAVMTATAVLCLVVAVPVVVLGPAVAVAVYTLGTHVDPSRGKPVVACVIAVMAVVVLGNGADAGTVVSNSVALAVAWWLGDRSRRAQAQTESERAAAAETARRAVMDERLRIARELHDVVAHSMSVIAVQAGTGRFVIRESPEVAAETLATIETTSRAALQELRRLLTVLRDGDAEDGSLLPAPGLRDVEGLAAASSEAGVDVEVVVRGEPRALPAGVDLCAYRVVQESLTNVRKHADARTAQVTITYEDDAVEIEVRDDGVGAAGAGASGGGYGLVGMRERVALYGGSLEAGANGTGFRVVARLPVEERR